MQFPCLMKSVDTELIVAFTDRTTGYVVVPDNNHPRRGELHCDWYNCGDTDSWNPRWVDSKINLNWRSISELSGDPRKLYLFGCLPCHAPPEVFVRWFNPEFRGTCCFTHFAEFDESVFNLPVIEEEFTVKCNPVTRAKIEALLKENK